MKKLITKSVLLLIIGLMLSINASAQKTGSETTVTKYDKIEVAKFDIKEGVEKFADSSLDVMMSEIVDQLKKPGKFKEVTLELPKTQATKISSEPATNNPNAEASNLETKAVASESTLRLIGTVTEYKQGNRTARYMIGLGAGRARIKAHIKILDSSGAILLERDVDGNVVMGAFGGDGGGITRGLAKEVAKVTLRKFFLNV